MCITEKLHFKALPQRIDWQVSMSDEMSEAVSLKYSDNC